ncbi:MAG: high potential iron-sulfur protein [Salinicola sp.]|uniref:high-potential iron-sulfur protein n=1 Tax=uncultured Salinicola sp. TaxID=1193542 RepID=UPI000C92ED31|nr:high-potential iron-sulfur protein [uncultured Salinicola sp.]MAM58508.1 high potential iron-sulfur protein [Salinicola sp.]
MHEPAEKMAKEAGGPPNDEGRRRLLRHGMYASGLLLFGWRGLPALAQDKPMLDPDAYQARALDYVEDASNAQGNSAYQAGRRCGNCDFFTASSQACGLFPDYRVASDGWCSGWTASTS